MKIVINACHGGFGLSDEAIMMYSDVKRLNLKRVDEKSFSSYYFDGIESEDTYFSDLTIDRSDKDLVAIVELLGEKANGNYAELKVVEIPDDVNWQIDEYDGSEWVAEVHRTWY